MVYGKVFSIELNAYQAANLTEVLVAIGGGESPLATANSGQWLSEVQAKLAGLTSWPPSKTADQMRQEAISWQP